MASLIPSAGPCSMTCAESAAERDSLIPSAGPCSMTCAEPTLLNKVVPLLTTTAEQPSTTEGQKAKSLLPKSCFVACHGADGMRPARTEDTGRLLPKSCLGMK